MKIQTAVRKRNRFLFSAVLGLVLFGVSLFFFNWQIALLAGWDTASLSLIVLIWWAFLPSSGQHTRQIALGVGVRYPVLDVLILLASLISLVIGVLLFTSSKGNPIKIIFCLFSIFCSWNLIHVLYAVHYSEMYYRRNAHFSDGGIDFNSKEAPDIWDFAYLSYTIGMTYQVSDTTFLTTDFRKLALSHALISFLFSTVLIATMINFIASLMS
ncbi:MAG: DUF1345 domain-containing protein [Oenococcus sp.]|uniref:DUF1345 domain-containing protein n=1 Tax=Oenococcus TaxID=46254 RepID=UPI0021E7F18E|nr:DUF1345 domain-containing protein [Oenococcus kitaharae]MCV3295978.1 DUF1345 domain-containing protein [Oenococcus kitaharae]